jgi:hypothetical protein
VSEAGDEHRIVDRPRDRVAAAGQQGGRDGALVAIERRSYARVDRIAYYPGNAVTELMKAGDTFFFAVRPDGSAMLIVTPAESTIQNQLLWLFGLEEQPEMQFTFREITGEDSARLDFAARYVLDELGIDPTLVVTFLFGLQGRKHDPP